MKIRLFWCILLLVLTIVACGGTSEPESLIEATTSPVQVTVHVTVETVAEITRVVEVTREIEVTRVIEIPVTITPSATPVNSPTPTKTPLPTHTPRPTNTPPPTNTTAPTNTPTLTPLPSATPDIGQTATIEAFGALAAPKGNGFYQIGVSILPGKWRSTGTGDGCYWARLDANQQLISNHFGVAGGTVTIAPSDYEVEFDDCGMWEYVENEIPVLRPDATAPKENGFFTVGIEISPGQWRSTGTADGCYWARLDANQGIVDNHFGNAGGTVTISASDYEIHFDDCGVWEFVGP